MTTLPVDAVLPDLVAALQKHRRAVLQAPPGAGKTSRVPLAMAEAGIIRGKIIMLEPRRLAVRAAADRLAQQRGEQPGATVGYRMRGDSKAGSQIEVVTEGILTRMIQTDPELSGIGAIIFDEFHERSLNADLGLAFALEIAQVLREDLHLVVMSATLDAAPVAKLLNDAPIITSEGRTYPVTRHYLPKALPPKTRIAQAAADQIHAVAPKTDGGILVFLPGEGEIRETAKRLNLPPDHHIRPLYGAMPFKDQRAAIQLEASGRKIVLATSIAETSLTIEDITVVIDAGRARRSRFDPNSGMSRLVTEKVSRAEATQRAGRAGRVRPGEAYALWTKGEDGALPAFPPAGIEIEDLAPLALELDVWGSDDLPFLTPPPPGPLAEARTLLCTLGARTVHGQCTDYGRALARLPVHPRLGHMLLTAGKQAAPLAALLSARDPLRGAPVDLALRVKAIAGRYDGPGEVNHGALQQIKSDIPRLSKGLDTKPHLSLGAQLALAYPDRIGLRRKGDAPRYILSGGKGAVIDAGDPLAGQRLIVATDLDGDNREARVRQAAALTENELRSCYPDQVTWTQVCTWSKRDGLVLTREQERFGALVLDDRHWKDPDPDTVAQAMCDGIQELGLRLSPAAARFQARVMLVRDRHPDLPAMDEETLLSTLEDWLLPHLNGIRSTQDWKRFDCLDALRAMLDWAQMQRVDQAAPAHFTTPLDRKIPIDYSGASPEITIRLQELFGVTKHPTVGTTPLKITLLSPGQKPVQVTTDLPGFWASSYADVRKDMRGRYPKHPWPEDPTQEDPTLRAKRRK
ncbi:MAG: ATP-dependent helicase HrpB [Pseudomonadota bacterium]